MVNPGICHGALGRDASCIDSTVRAEQFARIFAAQYRAISTHLRLNNMIKARFTFSRTRIIPALLFLAISSGYAEASEQASAVSEALIDQIVVLAEHGDPSFMEKSTAGYLIEGSKKFNPNVSDDTWQSVRADVNEIISNKVRSKYGEQALITRHFLKAAKFSDDEFKRLIVILQDPVMQRFSGIMQSEETKKYIAILSQQEGNQMWFVVAVVLRRHGLQTSDTPSSIQKNP